MLNNFKLVNTEGLTGLNYKGRKIPFDRIDDKLAEELIGRTHVLERVTEVSAVPEVGKVAPASTEPEAPAARKPRG